MSDEIRAWFPFYPADWLLSPTIRAMSLAARGMFVELMCWQWRDGHVPHRPEALAKLTGGTVEVALEVIVAWPSVNGQVRINRRLERVREEQKSKRAKRVAAGRLGGRAGKQSSSNAQRLLDQSEAERKKEGKPSAGTNAAESSYTCDECGANLVGYLAYSRHADTHKKAGA